MYNTLTLFFLELSKCTFRVTCGKTNKVKRMLKLKRERNLNEKNFIHLCAILTILLLSQDIGVRQERETPISTRY